MAGAVAPGGPGRHISFEACFNFRDLGGYPTASGSRVRWGQLYRADGLHRLTPQDRELFAGLGIVTVIDLRTQAEAVTRGRIEAFDGSYHHFPMFDVLPDLMAFGPDEMTSGSFVADRYREMLSEGSARLALTLSVLAEPGALPAVFHCSAGKDRTGIVAAIILRILGVAVSEVGHRLRLVRTGHAPLPRVGRGQRTGRRRGAGPYPCRHAWRPGRDDGGPGGDARIRARLD